MIRLLNRTSLTTAFAAIVTTIALALVFSAAPAQAAPSDTSASTPVIAAPGDASEIGALINERRCNVGERPKQIVLFLGIGGEDGIRCFGGTLGSINIGNAPVYDLYSGGYNGAIDCHNRLHMFDPEQYVTPIDICTTLTILPGS
ncbi:hypothetical protein [Glycomyces harbinensis]|uniref:Secreted protein n=1 Tax=Glycomyces harbinensis TaxID=58114 RepID=A0A1G6XIJ0_9ACTN|nr:hypothetical protein [Glycomyces harbinensis]SDD78018.1 hypothetical protein SAMN05216270_107195 [Glycomyces harbinensis]